MEIDYASNRGRTNRRGGVEENILAILDVNLIKDTRDANDDSMYWLSITIWFIKYFDFSLFGCQEKLKELRKKKRKEGRFGFYVSFSVSGKWTVELHWTCWFWRLEF